MKEDKDQRDQPSDFYKYSGIGMQMLATIGLAAWGGIKLDEKLENKTPWFTIGLILLAIFATLYLLIKKLTHNE